MSRVLITGAGLLGREVANMIARRHSVTVLDCNPAAANRLASQIGFEIGCITDSQAVKRLLADARPDAIVHTAALLGPSFKADPERGLAVNVGATLELFRSAKEFGVRSFVQASSLAVYDFSCPASLLDEESGNTSNDAYGIAKLQVEKALLEGASGGQDTVILRFAGLYGPEADGGGWSARRLWTAACAAARDEPLNLDGDSFGDNEYLHVRDAAEAVSLALRYRGSLLCNIGSGSVTRLRRLVGAFRRAAPSAQVSHTPRTSGAPDYLCRRRPLSIARAREHLGYAPTVPIATGIAELVAAARRSVDPVSRNLP